MTEEKRTRARFSRLDLAEIAVGACVMAFPAATTEEVWNLGEELTGARMVSFALASIFFLALLIYALHHDDVSRRSRRIFALRVFSTYAVTLTVSALLLLGLDRFDLFAEPWVSVKRAVLVAFPASFAATVVDGMRA